MSLIYESTEDTNFRKNRFTRNRSQADALKGSDIDARGPRFGAIITTIVLTAFLATESLFLLHWQLAVFALGAFFVGVMLDLWGAIWGTALQKEVPREALSRVSAFDAFGSVLLRPVGLIIAAPMVDWIGLTQTLEIFAGVSVVAIVASLVVPDVWKMQLTESSKL